MQILFDQGTPVPLRRFLSDHTVKTAAEQGWRRISNGELLQATQDAGFDVLVTTDQNMHYQQNLSKYKLAVVVLSNAQWPVLREHTALVVEAINAATPGTYAKVIIPERSR